MIKKKAASRIRLLFLQLKSRIISLSKPYYNRSKDVIHPINDRYMTDIVSISEFVNQLYICISKSYTRF